MFKNEKKPRQFQNRVSQNVSDFRGFKEKRTIQTEFKDSDFPELSQSIRCDASNNLNFMVAAMTENIDSTKDNDAIPFGWVRYRRENGVISADGNIPDYEDVCVLNSEEYNYRAINVFDEMIKTWANYKISYDDLHGEGSYEKIHEMPYYSSFNDCDDDEYAS
jgi:hypothetical protein